jgi:prolyl oligopeptidase
MFKSTAEALYHLVKTEWLMHQNGTRSLHDALKSLAVSSISRPECTAEQLCRAMDMACILYVKPVLCLQRSAATTMMLRRHGFSAELVIGARIVPFRAHAWVELSHQVINDKSYTPELYRELKRC